MNKRLVLLLMVFLASLSACGKDAPDYGCSAAFAALSPLYQDMGIIPEHFRVENPVENGTEFDPNLFIDALTHLSMEPGYVLDYVYTYDGMGGYPTLFARPVDSAPYLSWTDVPEDAEDYLDHVQVDDTPEGYLQYVLFSQVAEQFYLYWHSGYNDSGAVCNSGDVKTIIKNISGGDFGLPISISGKIKALTLHQVEPVVALGDDTVTVEVITFTMWGGFYQETYTIQRSFPHTILEHEEENIVPYDCGIMF